MVRCKVIFIMKRTTGSIFMRARDKQNGHNWVVSCARLVFLSTPFYITTSIYMQQNLLSTSPSNCFNGKFIFNAFASIKNVFAHLLKLLWPSGESMYHILYSLVYQAKSIRFQFFDISESTFSPFACCFSNNHPSNGLKWDFRIFNQNDHQIRSM